MLYDITDEEYFGICARCRTHNISDRIGECPTCGYDLGSINAFSMPEDPSMCPPPIDEKQSYLVFECKFPATFKLPFQMQGDCPVVVTALLQKVGRKQSVTSGSFANTDAASGDGEGSLRSDRARAALAEGGGVVDDQRFDDVSAASGPVGSVDTITAAATVAVASSPSGVSVDVRSFSSGSAAVGMAAGVVSSGSGSAIEEGTLLDIAGPQADWLASFGLIPAVGDVVLGVDGSVVTQLNSNQLKRFIRMRRKILCGAVGGGSARADMQSEDGSAAPTISILFRRHYLEVPHRGVSAARRVVVKSCCCCCCCR